MNSFHIQLKQFLTFKFLKKILSGSRGYGLLFIIKINDKVLLRSHLRLIHEVENSLRILVMRTHGIRTFANKSPYFMFVQCH